MLICELSALEKNITREILEAL